MAPAPYFKRRIVGDHSLLFFTFVLYYNIFYFTIIICNCLPGVPKSDSRPAWRWRRFFLFHPLRIPFLSVVRFWSPFATASGSVALADAHYLLCYIYICYVIVVVLSLSG